MENEEDLHVPEPPHSRPKIALIVGFILAIISTSGIAGYLIGSQSINNARVTPKIVRPEPTKVLAQKREIPPDLEFKKRHYNKDSSLDDTHPYPEVLTRASEEDLTNIKCTPGYDSNYDGTFTAYINDKSVKLGNDSLTNLIPIAAKTLPHNPEISAFQYCVTEDGREILEYEVWAGGGGSANVAYIGLIEKDGSITRVATIPNFGVAYFGCATPLQLEGDWLYYSCSGADGGGGGMAVYEIDLKRTTVDLLIKCSHFAGETTCEKPTFE